MKVKLSYTEAWCRNVEWEVDPKDVQEWAARPGQDPSEIKVTEGLLTDYFQNDFDYSCGDPIGWLPEAAGQQMDAEGYEFDHLDVDHVEVLP